MRLPESLTDVTETNESERDAVSVSVVVPVAERPDDLVELYREFSEPLRRQGTSFEFVFVAEPWNVPRTAALAQLASDGEPVRVIEMGQTVGEAALLRLGVARSAAPIIITLPAYRRVVSEALPELMAALDRGADLSVARRWPRADAWVNRVQNRLLHVLLGKLSSGKIRDVACGVRAMRREVVDELPLYGDFFRFLPVLALREGFNVVEIEAQQHPADTHARLYGPGTYLRRLVDILGLFFLTRFTEKPLRFFGLLGTLFALGGGGILVGLLIQRLGGQGIADRPLLLLAVLMVVLGVQAVALGLVGEIIVHLHASRRRNYRLVRESSRQSH